MLRRPCAGSAGAPLLFAAALGACALSLAAFAASGSGEGAAATAELIAGDYQRPVRIAGADLEPAPGREVAVASSASGAGSGAGDQPAKRRLKINYYIGVEFQTVAPGVAQLFEIRCPTRGEQPLTGGMSAPVPGLVAVNSSRTNPQPGFPSRPRAWYQAVINLQATALEWKPFVTCGGPK